MTLTQDRAADLRKDFPGWLIEEWWAWRKLTPAQHEAGCQGFLKADDDEGLRKQLKEQSERLAAVTE
jgi:hypothetical protein